MNVGELSAKRARQRELAHRRKIMKLPLRDTEREQLVYIHKQLDTDRDDKELKPLRERREQIVNDASRREPCAFVGRWSPYA